MRGKIIILLKKKKKTPLQSSTTTTTTTPKDKNNSFTVSWRKGPRGKTREWDLERLPCGHGHTCQLLVILPITPLQMVSSSYPDMHSMAGLCN